MAGKGKRIRERGEGEGAGTLPATPHDALFRALVSDPGRAAALLRDHLPERIAGLLAETPPRPVDGTFVDGDLRESRSDMLFEVELASGDPGLVYVLAEHKSHPDPGLPLQLAGYMVRIWTRWAGGQAARLRALPPIIPLVLYHGEPRWTVPDGLAGMIATEDPELVFLPGGRFVLCLLRDLPPERLSGDAALRAGLLALTHRAVQLLEVVAEGLAGDPDLRGQVIGYMFRTYPESDLDELRGKLRAVRDEGMEGGVRTIAEVFLEQGEAKGFAKGITEGIERGEAKGKAEGIAEGEAKGETRTLVRLLERRFGPLPRTALERIASAAPGQRDAWVDRIMDADSLETVLGAEG